MDLLVRDVPEAVHAELVRRAKEANMSLRAYVVKVLGEHASTPTMAEWLGQVAALPPVDTRGRAGADLVAEGRAEDERLDGT